MKFTTSIIIDLPLKEVVTILDNDQNLMHWQRGLVSFEHLSGTPCAVGSKMKLNYVFGYQKIALIKTTTKRQLPNELHFQFDMKGIHFLQENHFKTVLNNQTEWSITNNFVPKNFFTQLMVFFTPSEFKKQIIQYLKDFKEFAEEGVSVSEVNSVGV